MEYSKRPGTSAVQGQLYETKLISLILFRLFKNKDIEQFYLASNCDSIGAFDDICFKLSIKNHDRPIVAFIQAKHKENGDARLEYDLVKHLYQSIAKVKSYFTLKVHNKCNLFNGDYSDTDCVFILYTNSRYCYNTCDPVASHKYDILSDLLLTGDVDAQVYQPVFNKTDLQMLNTKILEENLNKLVEHLTKFLKNKSMNIMNDPYILQYHVILAQHVVHISDIKFDDKRNGTLIDNNEWRILRFRPEFFSTDDTILTTLRNNLLEHIVNNGIYNKDNTFKHDTDHSIDDQISLFLSEPSATALSSLIYTHIVDDKNKLKFIVERSNDDTNKLELIQVSQSLIEEAKLIAGKNFLLSLRLKVPITFGNIDLTIRGNDEKVMRRLNYLSDKINKLCDKAKFVDSYKMIVVDKEDGFSKVNGDIGGTVGNLLIYDEATKCLKFAGNEDLLECNANKIYNKLQKIRDDLHLYRFDMKDVSNFPKLVFDYSDEIKEILNKVLVFEKQSNHNGVEEILTNEISIQQRLGHNDLIEFDEKTIFLFYHHRIQEWWMGKEASLLLTKDTDLYSETISNIRDKPQMSAMYNVFYLNNIEYFKYEFTDNAVRSLEGLLHSIEPTHLINVIVTNITILTTMKLIQWQRHHCNKTYTVIDFEYMLKLQDEDLSGLMKQLKCTDKMLIIVCNNLKRSTILHKRLSELREVIIDKNAIIITNNEFHIILKEYFSHAATEIKDENYLTDLVLDSRKAILNSATVRFQGYDVALHLLVDEKSHTLIKGHVFKKILNKDIVKIGKSLKKEKSDKRYEEIKRQELFMHRRICRASNIVLEDSGSLKYGFDYYTVKTFHDIDNDVILLQSAPGMGKSLFLTHLTHITNETDEKFWIVRINVLEHTDEFKRWQKDKTVINSTIVLNFMCRVTLKHDTKGVRIERFGDELKYLNYDNEEAIFELNMFFRFYNERKVIILVDGVDEIWPYYKDEVINLLKIVKKYKIWVTSRSYSEIIQELEPLLGESYILEYINDLEQETFLKKFCQNKIPLDGFSETRRLSILSSLKLPKEPIRPPDIYNMYSYLCKYLESTQSKTSNNNNNNNNALGVLMIPARHRWTNIFLGTPLLLYLTADYITNFIINFDPKKSSLNINIFHMYERFIESKLTIFFKNKHGVKISDPLFQNQYEQELRDCFVRYKNIGAYTIFLNNLFHDDCCVDEFKDMAFNNKNKTEIEGLVKKLKGNEDVIGLISCITADNLPIFIHATFAEYFATEFICDILKSDVDIHNKKLLYTALRFYKLIMNDYWLPAKMNLDSELRRIIEKLASIKTIFEVLKHGAIAATIVSKHKLTIEQYIRIFNSTIDDYVSDSEELDTIIECIFDQKVNTPKRYENSKRIFVEELMGRMKSHLKLYFASNTSRFTPVNELVIRMKTINIDDE